MSLDSYNSASFIREGMEHTSVFVRVTAGPKAGTVARVSDIRQKYFSAHDYHLAVKGRRRFWMKGADLEYLPNHDGSTIYIQDFETPEHNDLMGRRIDVGHVLLFPRSIIAGAKVEMVLGTVSKISAKGAIYAKLFKGSQGGEIASNALVRVGKPSSAMIFDKNTQDQIMLAKLQSW